MFNTTTNSIKFFAIKIDTAPYAWVQRLFWNNLIRFFIYNIDYAKRIQWSFCEQNSFN